MMQEPQQPLNIGEMIFHHTGDSHEFDFAPFGTVHLPQWKPIHIGSWSIDVSPTKYVVLIVITGIITYALLQITSLGVQRARREGRAPGGFSGMMEALILWARQELVIDNIGHEAADFYAPLILTLFFFIWVANLIGLVPWSNTPSGNLAFTGALALIAFVVIEIGGMVKLGFKGYMGTIFPPIEGLPPAGNIAMSIFMAPIEFMSKLVKPFALTVRLFGNMTAGHFVILAMFGIVFMFGHFGLASYGIGGVTALVVLGVMILELVVATIQAYVFAVLTAVFIGLMQHEH
ncbi:MAG TPA: F0F1 ATP synthase subunit A [Gemmatimonadales bacterium]|jgi:F-type H+-transporting ATPase subunit a